MASLYDALESLEDPRSPLGRRHPLTAILSQIVVAMLGGARSLEAIAQFGRDRGESFGRALGYTHPSTPCKATFSNVLRDLPAGAFERVIMTWLIGREAAGWRRASLDGKTLCGATGERLPGVHLLAMFEHEAKAALAQMAVDAKTNEHKVALRMLDIVDVQDKVITGDAAFCQRDLSSKIAEKGGLTSGRSKAISPGSSGASTRSSSRRWCVSNTMGQGRSASFPSDTRAGATRGMGASKSGNCWR